MSRQGGSRQTPRYCVTFGWRRLTMMPASLDRCCSVERSTMLRVAFSSRTAFSTLTATAGQGGGGAGGGEGLGWTGGQCVGASVCVAHVWDGGYGMQSAGGQHGATAEPGPLATAAV
jgi:hypothetical protein